MEHGVQAGKEIELKGHSDSVDQVSWDPTAVDRLATISADKSLRLWDIRAGSRCVANVAMSGENINVNWQPGRHLPGGGQPRRRGQVSSTRAQGDAHGEVPVRGERDRLGRVRRRLLPHHRLGHGGGAFVRLKLTHLHTIRAHTAGLYCMAFDASRPRMALGSADALVSLWDLDEFTCLRTFSRLSWPVRTVSFSPTAGSSPPPPRTCAWTSPTPRTERARARIPTRAAMNSVRWSPTSTYWRTRGTTKGGKGEGAERGAFRSGARRDETDRLRRRIEERRESRRERVARETRERRVASVIRICPRLRYVRPVLSSFVLPTFVLFVLSSSVPDGRPALVLNASVPAPPPRHPKIHTGSDLMFDGAHRLSAGDDVRVRERRGVARTRARTGTRAARLNAASLALAAATARDVGNLCGKVAPFAPPAVDTSTLNSNLGGGGGDGASGHSTTDARRATGGDVFPLAPNRLALPRANGARSPRTTLTNAPRPAPRRAPRRARALRNPPRNSPGGASRRARARAPRPPPSPSTRALADV